MITSFGKYKYPAGPSKTSENKRPHELMLSLITESLPLAGAFGMRSVRRRPKEGAGRVREASSFFQVRGIERFLENLTDSITGFMQ